MKARELRRELESAGARVARTRGDHVLYKFPDGQVLSVPQGGRQSEASTGIIARARRVLRRNGLRVAF